MEGRLVGALLIARADPTGFSYNELLLSDRISAQIAGVVAVKIRQKELASEQERRHAAEAENLELVGAARARSEFLTTVSHELLTPVTIIASLTSSLSRRVTKADFRNSSTKCKVQQVDSRTWSNRCWIFRLWSRAPLAFIRCITIYPRLSKDSWKKTGSEPLPVVHSSPGRFQPAP